LEDIKICKICIQPSTRPGIFFSDEGICGACIWEKEEKRKVDWEQRFNELLKIAEWAKKSSNSNYDCVIGISGGKDSTFQAITARDRLGLHPLLVNGEPEGITDIGRHNIENLKQLGFDVISIRPNPKIAKILTKRDFYMHLNPVKIGEHALWASTYIIAEKFDIPLIIQGENAGLTLGTSLTGLGKNSNALNANELLTLKAGTEEYLEENGVEEKDLFFYKYNKKKLEEKNIRGVWLQYFLKEWSLQNNANFAKEYGLIWRPKDFDPESIGTYIPYSQLDSDLIQVNQMLKYIKFGFGQCMDHVCYQIRDGTLNRKKALELVKKYDGKCSKQYIQKFCNYIEIDLEEFWKTTEKFRGNIWKKEETGKWHNMYWDIIEKEV